jgi:hypothetical protein
VDLLLSAGITIAAVWNYTPKYQLILDLEREYKGTYFDPWSPNNVADNVAELYTDYVDLQVYNLTQTPDVLTPKVSAEGSLSASFGLDIDVGFTIYGFIDVGLYVRPNLRLQAYISYDGTGDCGIRLIPNIKFGSFVGNLRTEFNGEIEFDPLWEWRLFPHFETIDYANEMIPNALRTSSRSMTVATYCTGINDSYRNPSHRQGDSYVKDTDVIPIDISYKLEGKPLMYLDLRWALYSNSSGRYPIMTFDAGRYFLPENLASSLEIPCSNLISVPDDAKDDPNPTTPEEFYLRLEEGLKENWISVSTSKYLNAAIKIRIWWSPTTKTVTEEDGIGSTRVITKFYRKLNVQVLDCRDVW